MNKLKKLVIASGLIFSMSAFTLSTQTEAATTIKYNRVTRIINSQQSLAFPFIT